MIQPLKTTRRVWHLHWFDLGEAAPGADGGWFLPTIVVITDHRGTPVAPPEMMEEIDQIRVENLLLRALEKSPPPEQLVVPPTEDWDEEDWKGFSSETKIPIRFSSTSKATESDLRVVGEMVKAQGPGQKSATPAEIATSLVRTALRMRTATKRACILLKALDYDPDCSSARIEIADAEFNASNWKACGEHYDDILRREAPLKKNPGVHWWVDEATRPFLRALYGKAMTEWHLGRFGAAVALLEELIACNPRDNQGARFFIPMLHLLAEEPEKAAKAFERHAERYPGDFKEPSFIFGWALSCSLEGREAEAREHYMEGILKNIYAAPMLLEASEPPRQLWFPTDRAEPNYAADFLQSYAVLWDREPGALRILREVWNEMLPRVQALVEKRERMLELQDQRYDPDFKTLWTRLIEEEEKLTTP